MVNKQVLLPEQRTELNQGGTTPQIVILLTDGKSNDRDSNSLKSAVTHIKEDIKGTCTYCSKEHIRCILL